MRMHTCHLPKLTIIYNCSYISGTVCAPPDSPGKPRGGTKQLLPANNNNNRALKHVNKYSVYLRNHHTLFTARVCSDIVICIEKRFGANPSRITCAHDNDESRIRIGVRSVITNDEMSEFARLSRCCTMEVSNSIGPGCGKDNSVKRSVKLCGRVQMQTMRYVE